MHGFYSATADELHGHAVYLHQDGRNVRVTNVDGRESREEAELDYHWPDTEYVGIVTECVEINRVQEERVRQIMGFFP